MEDDKQGKKTKTKSINFFRSRVLPLVALPLAFLTGFLVLFAIHFASIKDTAVHYHANFELYVNGQRDEFKSFTFYEEVAACTLNDPDDLKTRVHMHDEEPDLVHVHAHAVTWGQFFANLGYDLGNKQITTDKGVFVDGENDNKLTFMLNGKQVSSLANNVIKSEDVLLINYGKDDESTLNSRFNEIPRSAAKANATQDPSTCSGSPKLTFTERLKQSLGISPKH